MSDLENKPSPESEVVRLQAVIVEQDKQIARAENRIAELQGEPLSESTKPAHVAHDWNDFKRQLLTTRGRKRTNTRNALQQTEQNKKPAFTPNAFGSVRRMGR